MKTVCCTLALALLAGCSRCGTPAGPADAGVHLRTVGDIHTALLYVYPEYRQTRVTRSVVELTRTYSSLPADFAERGREKLGWKPAEDGGTGWHINAFNVDQRADDELTIFFELDDGRVRDLFEQTAGASSMDLGLYLPREGVTRETFAFQVDYVTAPAQAAFLIRQQANLLMADGKWRTTLPSDWSAVNPDGGQLAPNPLDLTFTEVATGATMHLLRVRGHVSNRYQLVTDQLVQ